jgi:hypothetical protein
MYTKQTARPQIVEESVYPHVYAFAYILGHGESITGFLSADPKINWEDLSDIDHCLGSFSFNDMVRYATLMKEPEGLRKIHVALWALIPQFPAAED